jgi:hypothetical protein
VIDELIEDAEVRAVRREHGVSVLRRGDELACAGRAASFVPAEGDLPLDPR